jgi:CheY-like chemotaxis protein
LVADDNEFNIHALTLMLKSYKLKVDCAVNGSQALEKILKRKDCEHCDCQYALVLLDINMPVMNGYDTCVEIRNLIKNKKISPMHVVAVTADVTPDSRMRCVLSNFDSVVEKPIYKKTLEKILNNYLDGDFH